MIRYSVKDILELPHDRPAANYKDQIAVLDTQIFGFDTAKQLFSIDAFAIGYITKGYSITELNNSKYRLEPGSVFIMAPTHSCRLIECSPDYDVRLLLLDSNGHNMSIHLNYLVKSERWTQSYFNPVIKLNPEETATMNDCINRIIEQINRNDCPNQKTFLRLATEWHHVELDNIMQIRLKDTTDYSQPLTRQQTLARQLYLLIVNNYRKEHQAKYYAEQMCLTPQYLNQIASQVLGKTLSVIISELLYSTARSMLLSTDMSIQEIADELNFSDQASFSKFIKKMAGVSPNTLRKTHQHQVII
jgi:AraC-like DNA-binding protein